MSGLAKAVVATLFGSATWALLMISLMGPSEIRTLLCVGGGFIIGTICATRWADT